MLCVLFFPLALLVERRRNRCFFAILTLRIFEFAKNVLRNSLVLLVSSKENLSLSLFLSDRRSFLFTAVCEWFSERWWFFRSS